MIARELCRKTGFQFILDSLEPQTPFGAELVQNPCIYDDIQALQAEQNRLQTLLTFPRLAELTDTLAVPMMGVRDIRASLRRCAAGETLSLLELFEMKGLLLSLGKIRLIYQKSAPLPGLDFSDSSDALALLDPRNEGKRSFTIEDAATPEMFSIRRQKRETEAELYRADSEERRAELRTKRDAVCAAEDREERSICANLSDKLSLFCPALLSDCEALGHLDFLLCKAAMARRFHAVVPEIREGEICLDSMTNPMFCAAADARGEKFVSISIRLARGAAVITGANMGGKTVALKTLALNVLLAMTGYPVCAEAASLPPIYAVALLSGDSEDSEAGLSSFGGEILRIGEAMREQNENTLLLLDEPARGTNPDEGAAIVRGLVSYLNEQPGFSVTATHFDGVSPHANRHYRIVGLRDMDAEELQRELAFSSQPGPEIIARHMNYGLYRCAADEPCPHQATDICRLLGLPEAVMEKIAQFTENKQ